MEMTLSFYLLRRRKREEWEEEEKEKELKEKVLNSNRLKLPVSYKLALLQTHL